MERLDGLDRHITGNWGEDGMPEPGSVKRYQKIVSVVDPLIFIPPYVVQEKVDGSQFSFGLDWSGEVICRSHHNTLDKDAPEQMFSEPVRYAMALADAGVFDEFAPGTMFFCEYLARPKHNAMCYTRVPRNGLALFDVWEDGQWMGNDPVGYPLHLVQMANILGIESVPTYVVESTTFSAKEQLESVEAQLRSWHSEGGMLGGGIEGVVVKNYHQTQVQGSHVVPMMVKIVRKQFKERNVKEWKDNSIAGKVGALIASYATEARWQKAVQHLDEQGLLEHQPRDIGALIREIQRDLADEEKANIMIELWKIVSSELMRQATRGFPEWYKQMLTDQLWTNENEGLE